MKTKIRHVWRHSTAPLADLWSWAKAPDKTTRRHRRWLALAAWADGRRRRLRPGHPKREEWAKRRDEYEKRARATEPRERVPGINTDG